MSVLMRSLFLAARSVAAPSVSATGAAASRARLFPTAFPAAARALHTPPRTWTVYLSGEIHSDWREQIAKGVKELGLPVHLSSPITVHEDSDDCGAIILGDEDKRPNYDNKGAKMNSIRTKTLLEDADIVVVRFGEKYKQWNAAFDAGYAAALGKSIIVIHPPSLGHMLKEVNASAMVVCEEPVQVVQTLDYCITGKLPPPRDGPEWKTMMERMGAGNPNPTG
mmetsp:Transcript_43841/g.107158  ORF Transcript_43841/g.107158 Transcript_43841/m.107158 type:complete len:223 (-) Transcript_43841:148-816(-)|eukprot:CAMPEP_0206250288 /NCGR_PEP_ID=MMETSP0047_2-20121206/21389_1 /ASSEMBLY_ACC=CAM_ASM_000192 /TAXON_ID=195065 /ORGANISM="Chroomonas mesostigmatica_cf, Strain CCMP1168" /LENGTH=222 /DNA_ID=CAMNT_0053676121 /DNA_START=51 /DNA_END=719 /DNA_ORIENTATION=-